MILAEEALLLELVDARDKESVFSVLYEHTAGLSTDQKRAVQAIADSAQLVCPLSAPAGAGKTTSMRALTKAARYSGRRVLVVAPTGKSGRCGGA